MSREESITTKIIKVLAKEKIILKHKILNYNFDFILLNIN